MNQRVLVIDSDGPRVERKDGTRIVLPVWGTHPLAFLRHPERIEILRLRYLEAGQ